MPTRSARALMRSLGPLWLGSLLLLGLVAPLATAHDGVHGLHVTDVRFIFRAPSLEQEVRFVVHNDEDGGPTSGLQAEVSFAYTLVRQTVVLPELQPGTAMAVLLRVPAQVSAYGCVQAFAEGEGSDPACVASSGAGIG